MNYIYLHWLKHCVFGSGDTSVHRRCVLQHDGKRPRSVAIPQRSVLGDLTQLCDIVGRKFDIESTEVVLKVL